MLFKLNSINFFALFYFIFIFFVRKIETSRKWRKNIVLLFPSISINFRFVQVFTYIPFVERGRRRCLPACIPLLCRFFFSRSIRKARSFLILMCTAHVLLLIWKRTIKFQSILCVQSEDSLILFFIAQYTLNSSSSICTFCCKFFFFLLLLLLLIQTVHWHTNTYRLPLHIFIFTLL